MHAALIAAVLFALSGDALPVVEQECELVSVAHMPDHCVKVFFWGDVQREPACLEYRWAQITMSVSQCRGGWQIEWMDEGDCCYRIIRTPIWVESWEWTDPTSSQNKQWVGGLQPGLKQPPRVADSN